MKNHIKVNGKLLQTNKRFSQLKQCQRDWIREELYHLYLNKMKETHTTKKLLPNQRDEVISSLYEKIQQRGIWIPYHEIERYTFSEIAKIVRTFKKQFQKLSIEIEAKHAKNKRDSK